MLPDIRTLLSNTDIQTLREAFSEAYMLEGARASNESVYPPSAGLIEFMINQFYKPDSQRTPIWREEIIIAVLATDVIGNGLPLAMHLYWGLMAGLDVERICEVLLLVGVYEGENHFGSVINTFYTMITAVLRPALTKGGDAIGSQAIVGGLRRVFGFNTPPPAPA